MSCARASLVAGLTFGLLGFSGCKKKDDPPGEGPVPKSIVGCEPSGDFPDRSVYDEWLPVELEGAVCADGTPYKFFVKYVKGSTDLGITLEPGGACWDYLTCSGQGPGLLGALSLGGIDDDHMTALPPPLGEKEGAIPWGIMFPHIGESDRNVPTAEFNHVYFPYCTADGFTGDLSSTYTDSDGGEPITVEHRGRANLQLAAEWLEAEFSGAGYLHVMGASAGGLGATINYPLFRDAVEPTCASLINDSGPIFVGEGPQAAARGAFRQRWDLDDLYGELDERLGVTSGTGMGGATSDDVSIDADIGNLTRLLSREFPNDRFLVTFFSLDLNYPQFSYLSSYADLSTDDLFALWAEDTELLVTEIEGLDNWGYFIPYFRPDNCSHCVSLLPVNELEDDEYAGQALQGRADGYLRTEVETEGETTDFRDVMYAVLDPEAELPRVRAALEGEGFTAAGITACREGTDR